MLLHDVGRALRFPSDQPVPAHEHAGAAWCRPRVGARVADLVGAHVEAKRFLVATDPAYREALSPTSIRSLEVQGGSQADLEVGRFHRLPWAADAAQLRRWDDAAKVAGAAVPDIGDMIAVTERVGRRAR